MKTDAERMALIRQRTAQLQRQARARQMLLIDAGCMAACLALVVCLGLAMPGWAGTSVALHVSPTGTAGMLDGVIDRIREQFSGRTLSVVATGGNAPVIVKYCRNKIVYDKYLLMDGLWAIYQKNK